MFGGFNPIKICSVAHSCYIGSKGFIFIQCVVKSSVIPKSLHKRNLSNPVHAHMCPCMPVLYRASFLGCLIIIKGWGVRCSNNQASSGCSNVP